MSTFYRPAKKLLTDEQLVQARAAFKAGATRDEVAHVIGVSRSILEARLRDQLRDCRSGQGRGGGRRPPSGDPSPIEIRAATAVIRASWPDERWIPAEPGKQAR